MLILVTGKCHVAVLIHCHAGGMACRAHFGHVEMSRGHAHPALQEEWRVVLISVTWKCHAAVLIQPCRCYLQKGIHIERHNRSSQSLSRIQAVG